MSILLPHPHYKLSAFSPNNKAIPLKRSRLRIISSEEKPRRNLQIIKIIKPIKSPIKVKSIKGYSSYNSLIFSKKLKNNQIKRNNSTFTSNIASCHQTPKKFDTINSGSQYQQKLKSMRKCFGPYSFLAQIKNPFLHIESNFIKITRNQFQQSHLKERRKSLKNQKSKIQNKITNLKYQQIPFRQFIADSDQEINHLLPIQSSEKHIKKHSKKLWHDKTKWTQSKIFNKQQKFFQNRWQSRQQQQDQNMSFI